MRAGEKACARRRIGSAAHEDVRFHLTVESGRIAPHVPRLIVRLPAGFPNLIGEAAATGATRISRAPGSRLSWSFEAVVPRVLLLGVCAL
ncbi:MAG: hypothetical protein ACREDV_06010 [Methylocella sp.]